MGDQRLPHERALNRTTAAASATNWILALWMVAAFLGAFVATHYLLRGVLSGSSEPSSGIAAAWTLF